jgi:hypothetical protein
MRELVFARRWASCWRLGVAGEVVEDLGDHGAREALAATYAWLPATPVV